MPQPRLDTENARRCLQDFKFDELFVEVLNWNNPSRRPPLTLVDEHDAKWQAREISELGGLRVYEVQPVDPDTQLPDAKNQHELWKGLSAQSVENIAIFVDAHRTQSLWYWMKRDGQRTLPRRHTYIKNQPGDLFLSKLAALVIDLSELNERGDVSITVAAERVRSALDVETVTKVFFGKFKEVHDEFLTQIEGIADEKDRRWYASVLLNRLMFIWFLQKKFFLDGGDADYLRRKYDAARQAGRGDFFSHFLRDLFFEGFAKPEGKRRLVGSLSLGDIPYLNGGLFLPHGIEARTEGDSLLGAAFTRIRIPDAAFGQVFALFQAYSWNLNDTPGGQANEINPDVLGYIFEKYINQKEFGAYYTRPEITEYLCEQTIHQLVLDAAAKHFDTRRTSARHGGLNLPPPERNFDNLGDVLLHADPALCNHLLTETLPRLSLLDPACGSGAFLVAALKTMLGIYTGLLGRAEAINETRVLDWRRQEQARHQAPFTYWLKKKIITENLFGVDLMEEAVEIAKLRLFLTLVASATKRGELEPLPNIEFNLLPGNSLIGLLHVDPAKFDAGNERKAGSGVGGDQGRIDLVHEAAATELGMTVESKVAPTAQEKVSAHLAIKRARKYEELLQEKNRLVELYKRSAMDFEDLSALKNNIETKKNEARAILNKLLLDEFIGLGIRFEQAIWDRKKGKEGKSQRRNLVFEDIQKLNPFHWAYEFDETVVTRGGFDAIITNPPWLPFKPQAKKFFAEYSDLISKNKMTIKAFKLLQSKLIDDPVILGQWLSYLSSFSFVSAYYRNSQSYANQSSILKGKRIGSDINLYKLFVERYFTLLKMHGFCGAIVPGGLTTDIGAKGLRELLFDSTFVERMIILSNERNIFEIVHHDFQFCLLSFLKGGYTQNLTTACRVYVDEAIAPEKLEGFLHSEEVLQQVPLAVVRQLSPDSLAIMDFRDENDVKVATTMCRSPKLEVSGWNLRLCNEFHMTGDSELFSDKFSENDPPLVEGKAFHQFQSNWTQPKYWVNEIDAMAELKTSRLRKMRSLAREENIEFIEPHKVNLDYTSYRLAFRDVGPATNERSMIATVLPRRIFCPHTVSLEQVYYADVLNGELRPNCQHLTLNERLCLCSIFNSFVVDSWLRRFITKHVSFFHVYSTPIPYLSARHPSFRPLVEHAARLVGTTAEFDDLLKEVFGPNANHQTHGIADEAERLTLRAEIDARVAQIYDLTEEEFDRILSTFPLVKEEIKTRTLATYRALLPSADDAAVARLIAGGETDKVEFKEAAAYSRQTGSKQPGMLAKVLQEVAAFLNTAGGSVLIGVDDAGKVTGLANDFPAANPNKPNSDGYSLFLREAMSNRLDAVSVQECEITFHQVEGQTVCRILVPASPRPVYLDQGEMFIRSGTTSRALRAQDAVTYAFQHWGKPS